MNPQRTAPRPEQIAGMLATLEIFGATPSCSPPTGQDAKLVWNLRLRYSYGQSPVWPFTAGERYDLLRPASLHGFPVPRFMRRITELLGAEYFAQGYAWQNPPWPFELYLMDQCAYLRNDLFPGMALPGATLRWFHEEAPLEHCTTQPDRPPLPKIALITFWQAHAEKRPPVCREEILAALGRYLIHYLPAEPGAGRAAARYKKIWAAPSPIPGAAQDGLTLLMEAAWRADPVFAERFTLDSSPGRLAWQAYFAAELETRMQRRAPVNPGGARRQKVKDAAEGGFALILPAMPPAAYQAGGHNLVGWPQAHIGIGEDTRSAAAALWAVKAPFVILDAARHLPPHVKSAPSGWEHCFADEPVYDTDIYFLDAAAVFRYQAYGRLYGWFDEGRRVIAACPWELPLWPAKAAFVLQGVHEFWAATRYIRQAFSPYFSPEFMALMPPTVIVPQDETDQFDPRRMDGPFTFLTIFDGLSSLARKNPQAVAAAFQRAFPSEKDARLVIKGMHVRESDPSFTQFQRQISSDKRIELINKAVEKKELYALIRRTHCFVSLHRAEGFGRNIAENMLFGRPVIVSNFSGNTDFCHAENSCLVSGGMIPIPKDNYWFAEGQEWFEPEVEEAAAHMRAVFYDRGKAARIAAAGREYIRTAHSPAQCGANYMKRM